MKFITLLGFCLISLSSWAQSPPPPENSQEYVKKWANSDDKLLKLREYNEGIFNYSVKVYKINLK